MNSKLIMFAMALSATCIKAEARDVGKVMAGMALPVARHGQPFNAPCILLSGGESTVTVRGNGRGGRNVEFLLALGISLDGQTGIHALAGDTDGVDGQEETPELIWDRMRCSAPGLWATAPRIV